MLSPTKTTVNSEPLITVKNLDAFYMRGDNSFTHACKDVGLEVKAGETVGLLGESGAGKSTVAYAMMGLIAPPNVVKGEIVYAGKDVLEMNQKELRLYRWNEVAMIFQAAMNSLDPVVTVGKNMDELILDKHIARKKTEARELSQKLLRMTELNEEVYGMYPFELSGGMKQRVIIAMALAANPKILILDEPTTALDTITQFSVLSTIKSLQQQGLIGSAVLISHDISVQAFMVDRILVMLKGFVVEAASKVDILQAPKHPYTQVLNGLLKLDSNKRQGVKDETDESGADCPFANFCPYVMSKCTAAVPPLVTIKEGHVAACYLYTEGG